MALPWDARQIYRLTEQVTLNGSTFSCARDYNFNNVPALASTWWTDITPGPSPSGGVAYVGQGTLSFPPAPTAGANASAVVALATTSQLAPSSVYLIIGSITMAASNSDGTPQTITWAAGDDALRVGITTPTIVPGGNVDQWTNSAIWNERGYVGTASDYSFTLMASTSSAPPSGNLVLEIDVYNVSGTVAYGNLSNVQAFVYKIL